MTSFSAKKRPLPVLLLIQLAFFTSVLPAMTLTDNNIQPAPDFSLVDINGEVVSLSTLREQNSLLLFGSTQCPHCETALVLLEDISQVFGDDLKVVFVAIGQTADELADFFIGGLPSYNILLDESGVAAAVYGVKQVLSSIFI